ncbi:Catechol-2,3-dioxygenase [compost metagenome]
MAKSILTDSLHLAPSTLYVGDLARMVNFYHVHVGLDVLEKAHDSALLGQGHAGVIRLVAKPKLQHASPRAAGLFHNAVLFSSRGELSRTVGDIVTASPQLFSGTGDHLVSEAFYFNDPEGNGLELYFDRPADTWQWINGQVAMDTLYIDPLDYIQSHASERGPADIKLGHVHLKIGDILEARRFYVNVLGFDVTADIGAALFVSIGGYHHHIGLNTWLSNGAGIRGETLGLSDVKISLATDDDISQLSMRLEQAAYPFVNRGGSVYVTDPWGNNLIFHAG